MRYLVVKDKVRRSAYSRSERNQLVFKALKSNSLLRGDSAVQGRISSFYYALPRRDYRTRIRNRCLVTGRGSSIIRHFRVSRLQLREFFSSGYLYGFRRSSW